MNVITVVKAAPCAAGSSEPVILLQNGISNVTKPAASTPALTLAVGAQLVVVEVLVGVEFGAGVATAAIKRISLV